MKLLLALTLFTTVSSAYGHRCYSCASMNPTPCSTTVDCAQFFSSLNMTALFNNTGIPELPNMESFDYSQLNYQCYTVEMFGVMAKGCMIKEGCVSPIRCCKGELCNSAPRILGPLLMLGLTVFLTLNQN